MKKEELEKELKELKEERKWDNEKKCRYNKILEILLEKLNLSVDKKLELALLVYSFVRIKKNKENDYIFEVPIKSGWCSGHFETISDGVDWLLKKN